MVVGASPRPTTQPSHVIPRRNTATKNSLKNVGILRLPLVAQDDKCLRNVGRGLAPAAQDDGRKDAKSGQVTDLPASDCQNSYYQM